MLCSEQPDTTEFSELENITLDREVSQSMLLFFMVIEYCFRNISTCELTATK